MDVIFQRLMEKLFQGLPYCFVFVDNVLISSPDLVSHLEHVQRVLDLLHLHGLSINPDKCLFAAPTVDYLGMRVSGSDCFPLVKHTEIISAFPCPSDMKEIQRFLGILIFYRRLIKGAAGLLLPLTEALKTFTLDLEPRDEPVLCSCQICPGKCSNTCSP